MRLPYLWLALSPAACMTSINRTSSGVPANWCDRPMRPQPGTLTAFPTAHNWFKVYVVDEAVYAIAEPYNFQEVISYLVIGKSRTLHCPVTNLIITHQVIT